MVKARPCKGRVRSQDAEIHARTKVTFTVFLISAFFTLSRLRPLRLDARAPLLSKGLVLLVSRSLTPYSVKKAYRRPWQDTCGWVRGERTCPSVADQVLDS